MSIRTGSAKLLSVIPLLLLIGCGSPEPGISGAATPARGNGPNCSTEDFILSIADELGEDQAGGPRGPLEALRAFIETEPALRGLDTSDWQVTERTPPSDNRPEEARLGVARGGNPVGIASALARGDSWSVTGFSACRSYVQENGGGSE